MLRVKSVHIWVFLDVMRLCFSFFSRALYINLLGLCSFLVCSLFAGMCLYSIYKNCDPLMAGQISSHDQVWWRDAQQSWELWLSVLLGLIRTGLHKAGHYDLKSILQLKHQYVTLTVTGSFENQLNNARLYVAQNSNFFKIRSYFTEKVSSAFPPEVLWLLSLSSVIYRGSWKQHKGCLQTEAAAAAAAGHCWGQFCYIKGCRQTEQL